MEAVNDVVSLKLQLMSCSSALLQKKGMGISPSDVSPWVFGFNNGNPAARLHQNDQSPTFGTVGASLSLAYVSALNFQKSIGI